MAGPILSPYLGPGDGEDSAPALLNPILFAVCLAGWLLSWAYCFWTTGGNIHLWGNSPKISNLHSVPLCALALLSVRRVVSERVPLAFSLAFFATDLLDCVVRRDLPFLLHAILSIALNVGAAALPGHPLHELRSLSKGFLVEASTIFLNRWKRTHRREDYVTFFAVFIVCRIAWVPCFVYEMYTAVGEVDAICLVSAAFYVLQLAWYAKMISILRNYRVPAQVKLAKEDKEA